MKKLIVLSLCCAILTMFVGSVSIASAQVAFEGPAIATTCGQSPGALMVKMIAQRAGIQCDQDDALTAATLAAGSYKTLFITMGTSGKGLGAAGINMEDDVARINELIAKARELGIKLIGTQFEGMARRTDANDELSIDTVAPFVDAIMIKADSDGTDQRFTRVAEQNNIPIYSFAQPLESQPVMAELFGQ